MFANHIFDKELPFSIHKNSLSLTIIKQSFLKMGKRFEQVLERRYIYDKDVQEKRLNIISHAAAAKSVQSCRTLCDPTDSSPPGSPIPGFLQARTLEWVAISFCNACKWKVKMKSLGRVRLLATPWTAAYQAPSSMGFSRQEYWSGVPLPSLVLWLNVS